MDFLFLYSRTIPLYREMRGDDVVEVVRSSPEWSGFEMRGLSLMESSISSPDVSRETSGPLRDRKHNGCSFKRPSTSG